MRTDNLNSPAALTDSSILHITGAEFAVIRELLQRSRDEHMSRVRDNNLGLGVLDGLLDRYYAQHAATVSASHQLPTKGSSTA